MSKRTVLAGMALTILAIGLHGQDRPITPYVPEAGKIWVSGIVVHNFRQGSLEASLWISNRGSACPGLRVWLNSTLLDEDSDHSYHGRIDPYRIAAGDTLKISVEFRPLFRPSPTAPPFSGKQVVASYRVENFAEITFPSPSQELDLSAYPAGTIPFRWDFLGAPVRCQFDIADAATNANMFKRVISAEGIDVPVSALSPGREYWAILSDEFAWCEPLGRFKMGKLTTSTSGINFLFSSSLRFRTVPAK